MPTAWKTKAQERIKEKSQGSTIKLDEGTNCLRVLPDKKDILPDGRMGPKGVQHEMYREFRIHREVGPDKVMLACGKDMEGNGECWLDDVKIPELEGSDNKNKRLLAQKIQAQEQFVVNASRFDVESEKFTAAKPWWVSTGSGIPGRQQQSLAVRVFSKMSSEKKDYIDPNKGYNLNVERTGQGLKTRYPAVEGDEAPSKVPAAILAAMKDLDSVVPVYDEEDQKSAYYGRPRKGDTDDDEEEGDGKGKKKKKEKLVSKPRHIKEESEDETDEEETEVKDEEEEETEETEEETEDADDAEEETEDEESEVDEEADEESDESDDEEEEEEEEEEKPPAKKKAAAPPAKKKTAPPAKKTATKPGKKR